MNDLRNFGNVSNASNLGGDAAAPELAAEPPPLALTFTGTGAEYFRIWIVNLTLTLCTLGAYGAWAKVRRTQYFYRNTQLAGVCFDYTAQPQGILMGRILALLLLSVYTFAYNYSPEAGGVVTLIWALLLPALLWQAQRFRARNSLHRGVAFGFTVPLRRAYTVYLPPILVLFAPAVITALALGRQGGNASLILSIASFVLLPFFHARFRRFVQSHTAYGAAQFGFSASNGAFFKVWLKGMGMVLLASVVVGVLVTIFVPALVAASGSFWTLAVFTFFSAVAGYVAFVMVGAYYTARFQNMVWNATTALQGLRFESRVLVWRLLKIRALNLLCVVLTLGLFRPFAAIREMKYRLGCVQVHGYQEAQGVSAGAVQSRRGATGESAAELFDLDVGL